MLSMKESVKEALKEYQHKPPPKPFDAPTKYHKPEFGQKIQYDRTDESKPLSPKQKQYKMWKISIHKSSNRRLGPARTCFFLNASQRCAIAQFFLRIEYKIIPSS
jgi:hypothetical protein